MMLRPADRVEKYVVDAMLGRGGMAVVYRVRHAEIGTLHALKVLAVKNPELAERLVHEGRVQGRLRHPNVVAVTDVVRVGEAPALVVELVDGPNLADWLGFVRPSPAQIDALARGILAGVDAAHRLGLVHRDLKPANVLLQVTHDDVTPKVSDFGLAKVLDREAGGYRTRAGTAMGTPVYMPPEQFADASEVDQRADVFSLGALLLELLLGLRDEATDFSSMMDEARAGRPPDLTWLDGRCPERWRDAVLAALALSPEARPKDAGALREAWTGGATPLPEPWPLGAMIVLQSMTRAAPTAAPRAERTGPTWVPVGEAETTAPVGSLGPAPRATAPPAGGPAPTSTAPLVGTPATPPRSWRRWGLAAATVAGLAGAAAVARWATLPPTPAYAAEWRWQGGDVVLVGTTDTPPAPGATAWRVTWEGGRITQLDRVNFRGALWGWDTTDHDRPVSLILERDADAHVTAIVQRVETGRPVHRVVIDRRADEIVLRHQSPTGDAATSPWIEVAAPGLETRPHPLVEVHRLDAAGRVTTRLWRGLSGQPARGDDGTWGVAYAYDDAGRVTRRTSIGPDERPMRDEHGVIAVALAYEDPSHPTTPTRWTLEGIGGLPGLSPAGWHTTAVTLDAEGRAARQTFTDAAGNPTPDEDGCAAIARAWTADTREVTCLDGGGAPTPTVRGWHRVVFTLDARGFPIEDATFDANGAPAANTRGVHRSLRKLDESGRVVEIGPKLDLAGTPVPLAGTAAIHRFVLDDYGWPASNLYLDAAGQPTPGADGVVTTTTVYTPRGIPLDVQAWDASGAPAVTDAGWVRTIHERDTRGNLLSLRYLDANGAPVNASDGWARELVGRDANGNTIELTFFGADGRRATSAEQGFSRSQDFVDERGLSTRTSLFDVDDKPMLGLEGWASVAWTHDARGLITSATYYGTDGERIMLEIGSQRGSRVEYTYDAAGREIQVTYRDTADALVTDTCAHRRWLFDERGQDAGWSCLGPDEAPRAISGTVATVVIERDAAGRQIAERYLGVDGKPTVTTSGRGSIAYTLDTRGQVVTEAHLDLAGAPIDTESGYATLDRRYDPYGRLIEETYRRADGALYQGEGWARRELVYDARGRVAEERQFGADGQPYVSAEP